MYLSIHKTIQNQVEKSLNHFLPHIEVYDENISYKYK